MNNGLNVSQRLISPANPQKMGLVEELFLAVIKADNVKVGLLIDNDVDVNFVRQDGQTALLAAAFELKRYAGTGKKTAAKMAYRLIIKLLLNKGANPFLGAKIGKNAAEIIEALPHNQDLKKAVNQKADQFSVRDFTP